MHRNSVTNAFGLILGISTLLFFGSIAFVFLISSNGFFVSSTKSEEYPVFIFPMFFFIQLPGATVAE